MIPAIDDVSKSYASNSPEISPSVLFQPEDQILIPFLLQSSQGNLAEVSDIELHKRRSSFCQPTPDLRHSIMSIDQNRISDGNTSCAS